MFNKIKFVYSIGTVERKADRLVDYAANGDIKAVKKLLAEGQPPDMLHSVSFKKKHDYLTIIYFISV